MQLIPYTQADLAELRDLPIDVRLDIDLWVAKFRTVRKPITKALERIAKDMGVSFVTARRKYSAWINSGKDWHALINKSKCPDEREAVSEEFVEWFKALCEKNQRASRPAHRKFLRMWHEGKEIPGLDNSLPRHKRPKGCSYENLLKHMDKLAQKLIRQGTAAAAKHAPQIFTTRAGLWVGSHYMFDDLFHDNFVMWRGKLVRVLEIDGLDVFSAYKFAWGTKPRFQRQDGSFDGLKEHFMRMILASALFNEGYSERGTVLMAEHGTAAIRERIEQLLFDRTGGKITVRRSGITGKEQAVIGLFRGKGGGNPRFKAPLESLRNLIHNELADIPGQTGKDVDHRPEHTHGLLEYASDMIKAVAVLAKERPERAALIRHPVVDYHSQFLPLLSDVYERINRRDWHELEGWSECGHITIDYRLSPDSEQWMRNEEAMQLAPAAKQFLVELAKQDSRCLRQRKLSPKEVWSRGREQLVQIPAFVVAEILGEDFAEERPCADGYFIVENDEIAAAPVRYESRITTPDERVEELKPGTYLTFVNPFDAGHMFVHDARGRHLGIAKRVVRPGRADEEALRRAFGHNNKRHAELIGPIRERHAEYFPEPANDLAHNTRVLDTSKPLTAAEKAQEHLRRKANQVLASKSVEQPAQEMTLQERAHAALTAKLAKE